ncbi:zinc finger protein Eos isoform X1 [Eucyclogobius newberryi]|uniref:zinc finger protein Eos isoform X1 n=1 Tax=Eucyclogobius newberryi TaxID=166745 RepID=UPI003B5A95C9
MGPEVVLKGFPGTKNPGDAVVAWENKRRSRQLERQIALGRQKSGERMNADDCNGRTCAGNGGGSTEQDYYGGQQGPSKSPHSQKSSPQHSLSTNSIKVELCSDDESPCAPQPENTEEAKDDPLNDKGDPLDDGGAGYALSRRDKVSVYGDMASPNTPSSPGPIRLPNGKLQCEVCGMICIGPNVLMVHKRSHTGERPFQCNQCGASFTQKGNLLRHIKLHSGEKPFKCPICNYACRRRDALAGHLRTHAVSSPTVGKPFKCSYCSRSYKQQSTLEEHLERCHSYLKSLDNQASGGAHTTHDDKSVNMETITKTVLQPSNDKIHFAERLSISMTKRKRSTPQKFLGEKHMHLDLPDAPYELSSGSEKEGELLSAHFGQDSVGGLLLQSTRSKEGNHEPSSQSQPYPTYLSVMGPLNNNLLPQGQRAHAGSGLPFCLTGRDPGESQDDQPSAHSLTTSPNGCPDSTDTESTAEEQSTRATGPTSTSNNHHLHFHNAPLSRSHPTSSPNQAKDVDTMWVKASPVPPASVKRSPLSPLSSRETLQVLDRDGRPVRSFHCRHCRILFLDHVLFTIHMGCHGFRQPFECNICGHSSHDRYEFSSHISRGEHQVG